MKVASYTNFSPKWECHIITWARGRDDIQWCMFRTACKSGGITLWGWPEFPLPGNGSRIVCILAVKCGAALLKGGRTTLCTFLTLLLTVWGDSAPLVPGGLQAAQLPATSGVCPYLPFLFLSHLGSLFPSLLEPPTQPAASREWGAGPGSNLFKWDLPPHATHRLAIRRSGSAIS